MSWRFSSLRVLLALQMAMCGASVTGCANKLQLASATLRGEAGGAKPDVPIQLVAQRTSTPKTTTFAAKKPGKSRNKSAQEQLERQISSARLMERRGQIDSARSDYKLLVEKYPEHPLPHHRLGVMAAQAGRFEEAEQLFQRAVACGDPTAELLCDLGYTLYLQDRLPQAEQVLRDALSRNNQHAQSRNNLGLVLGQMGHFEEALSCFRANGTGAEAHANMAYVHTQRNEVKLAQQHYLRALSLDPNMKSAAEALLQLSQIVPMPTPDEERERIAGASKPRTKSRGTQSNGTPRRAVAKSPSRQPTPVAAAEEAHADELLADDDAAEPTLVTKEPAAELVAEESQPEAEPKQQAQAHAPVAPVHRTPYSWNTTAPQTADEQAQMAGTQPQAVPATLSAEERMQAARDDGGKESTTEESVADTAARRESPARAAARPREVANKRTMTPSVTAAAPRPAPKTTISPYSSAEPELVTSPAEDNQPTAATTPSPVDVVPSLPALPEPVKAISNVPPRSTAPRVKAATTDNQPTLAVQPQRVVQAPARVPARVPASQAEPQPVAAIPDAVAPKPASDVAPAMGLAGIKAKVPAKVESARPLISQEPSTAAIRSLPAVETAAPLPRMTVPSETATAAKVEQPPVAETSSGPRLSFPSSAPRQTVDRGAPTTPKVEAPRSQVIASQPKAIAAEPGEMAARPKTVTAPPAQVPEPTAAKVAVTPRGKDRYAADGTPTMVKSSAVPLDERPVARTEPGEAATSGFRMSRPLPASAAANRATSSAIANSDTSAANSTPARLPAPAAAPAAQATPTTQSDLGQPTVVAQSSRSVPAPRPLPSVAEPKALPARDLAFSEPATQPATDDRSNERSSSLSLVRIPPTTETATTAVEHPTQQANAVETDEKHSVLRMTPSDLVAHDERSSEPAVAERPVRLSNSQIGFAPIDAGDGADEATPAVVHREQPLPRRSTAMHAPATGRTRPPGPIARTANLPPRRMAPVVHAPPSDDGSESDGTPGFAIATDNKPTPAPAGNIRR